MGHGRARISVGCASGESRAAEGTDDGGAGVWFVHPGRAGPLKAGEQFLGGYKRLWVRSSPVRSGRHGYGEVAEAPWRELRGLIVVGRLPSW